MLIKNVHIDNHEETSDVRIVNGKFKEIAPALTAVANEQVIDGQGMSSCHRS